MEGPLKHSLYYRDPLFRTMRTTPTLSARPCGYHVVCQLQSMLAKQCLPEAACQADCQGSQTKLFSNETVPDEHVPDEPVPDEPVPTDPFRRTRFPTSALYTEEEDIGTGVGKILERAAGPKARREYGCCCWREAFCTCFSFFNII